MLIRKDRLVLKVSADGERVCGARLFNQVPGKWFRVGGQMYIGRCLFHIRRGRVLTGVRLDPAVELVPKGQISLKLVAGAIYGVVEHVTGRIDVMRIRPEEVRQLKCEQILELAGFSYETIVERTNLESVSANAYDACVTDGEKLADGSIRGGTFALFGNKHGGSPGFRPGAAVITSATEPGDLLLTLAASGSHWPVPALREAPAQPVAATR